MSIDRAKAHLARAEQHHEAARTALVGARVRFERVLKDPHASSDAKYMAAVMLDEVAEREAIHAEVDRAIADLKARANRCA